MTSKQPISPLMRTRPTTPEELAEVKRLGVKVVRMLAGERPMPEVGIGALCMALSSCLAVAPFDREDMVELVSAVVDDAFTLRKND